MAWRFLTGQARDGLIVLAQRGLSVGPLSHLPWRADAQFALDPAGLADFAAYCRHNPYRRFRLLVLGGDEEFKSDTLPPVRGRDRQLLIQRRLEQAWRGTPYRRARVLGDGTLVLSALTQRDQIDAVVKTLLEAGCAIAGIHAASGLLAGMLARLALVQGPTLLLSPLVDAGIQQAWLTPDGLRFARVSQGQTCFVSLSAETVAPVLADEVRLTLQYLASERLLSHASQVTVLLLDGDARVQALAAQLQQRLIDMGETAQVSSLPLNETSRALGQAETGDLLGLLAGTLGRRLLAAHYASAEVCRFETVRRTGLVLRCLGAMGFAAAAFWSLSIWLAANALDERTATQQSKLTTLQRESQRVAAELVKRDVGDPVALRAVDTLYRAGMASWPSAEASARGFSRIIASFPAIRIDALAWEVAPPVAPPSEDAAPVGGTVAVWTQTVSLSGHVLPPVDARQALAQVEALAARLRIERGMVVEVVKLPLDIRPQATIQSQADAPAEDALAQRFVLKLTQRAGADQ
ncbi:hypothetical protein JHS3_29310 [Jeongeupia sp. HS-3]|uniref:hypothetical protein n=1 Tax=Jeongeupia sp. HS-3 TaxID=1009682 RepID=UPI0018A5372C|nr:hypothetical protein [Jeongeupia sp. HS-3]BCL77195.1 hypothetical protein JHS3_29310 [Jeongeupia sp. HS-3]